MTSIDDALESIARGADEILLQDDLVNKLKRGKPLRIKAGFDPTAPDLHLGHTVLLNKMRQFQELGHEVVVTARDFARGMTYLGRNPCSMSTPISDLGRSRTWPTEARTSYCEPNILDMVRALAGDSTTTRLLVFLFAILNYPP